jgi:hypothetical protein
MAHGLYQRSIVSPLTTASETLQLLLYPQCFPGNSILVAIRNMNWRITQDSE